VARVVQPVRVHKARVLCAERLRFLVHQLGERFHRACGMLREGDRRVVGGAQHQRVEQVAYLHLFADAQVHRTRLRVHRALGGFHHRVQVALLQHEDGGHHLREAGRRERLVRVFGVQHLSRFSVHQNRCARLHLRRACPAQRKRKQPT
jgi:hypothetical protein